MIRLAVFDLDGTLVDSRRDLAESANEVLIAYGGRPHTEEAVGRMVGEGAATLVSRVFTGAGLPLPPDALERFLAAYNRRPLRHTRPYEGVTRTLELLGQTVTLALLTNKPRACTEAILAGLNLAPFFGTRIVAGDDAFPRKPDPAGLTHLMTAAGTTADQTLLVGDSVVDWRTARAAGTHACIVRYGYGFAGFPTADLNDRERIVERFDEVLATL